MHSTIIEQTKEPQKTPAPMSYARYQALTANRRCEFIGGVIYDLASPSKLHQAASMLLSAKLFTHLAGKQCRVYCAPYDVVFKGEDDACPTLQPDLLVLCKGRTLPSVVVEILSFSERKRRNAKMEIYCKYGVEEYWELNPDAGTISLFALENGRYVCSAENAGTFYSNALCFSLDVDGFYDEIEEYLVNS